MLEQRPQMASEEKKPEISARVQAKLENAYAQGIERTDIDDRCRRREI